MFDFFRRHTRVLQFVLVLLVFPSFVFFGIQGYSGMTERRPGRRWPRVDGQQDHARWSSTTPCASGSSGRAGRCRASMPSCSRRRRCAAWRSTPLIRERVLAAAADKLHLAPSDERLRTLFKSDPAVRAAARSRGLRQPGASSPPSACRRRRSRSGCARTSPPARCCRASPARRAAPAAAASAALDAMYQQREIQVQRFDAKDQLAKVAPTDAEVEAYYKDPANAAQFRAPEEASIEYVVLDLEALKKGIAVPEDELRKYYAENEKRFTAPEERRASHILIKADKDAPKAEREKARAKAEALLAEVRKDPAKFAEIAKKNSEDEGSAEKRRRPRLLRPRRDGQAVRGRRLRAEAGRDERRRRERLRLSRHPARRGARRREEELRRRCAPRSRPSSATSRRRRSSSQAAVDFDDMVYQQSESLKPAADRWKLEIADGRPRDARAGARAAGPLANAKFLEALFSQRRDAEQAQHQGDRHRRRTSSPPAASSAYSPAHQLPLAEVQGQGAPAARRQPGGGDGDEARHREARRGPRRAADAALRQHADRLARPAARPAAAGDRRRR